jgi:hydrogenase nickel incorporation protein HypA/HybF
MHEAFFTKGFLSLVLDRAKEAQASKITKISIIVGGLSGIVPECVELQFKIFSKNTIADKAEVTFQHLPARLRCRECDIAYSCDNFDLDCPRCGHRKIEILSGRECYVDSIEVE